jgi:dihydroneopterin triphosphate diphosphatase
MPEIVSDIVDVYVFRRLNARVQFLLLQRKATVPLGNTWQSFHTQIQAHETTLIAARRAVRELAGLSVSEAYSADYINEFFDDTRDVVVLAPVLAVNVSPQAPVTLGRELREASWWDTNQAMARLPFSGQRWAVKHISELMSAGYTESQLYRLQLPEEVSAPVRPVADDTGKSLSTGPSATTGLVDEVSEPSRLEEPIIRDFFHEDTDGPDDEGDDEPFDPTPRYRTDVPKESDSQ